jgi:ABC-type spermidine/putrescine transport system permease subunit II
MNDFWSDNKAWIIPMLVFVWGIYSPAVYKEWVSVWSDKTLGTWRKIGYSIRALASAAVTAGVAFWKQYGGSIIAFVVTLFRVKFGVPAAVKMAGKALK